MLRHLRNGCDGTRKSVDSSKVCLVCGRGFANVYNRKRHEEVCDGGVKRKETTRCSKCLDTFSTIGSRKRHESGCSGESREERMACSKNHSHHMINREFSSFEEAKQWVKLMEFDQEFRKRDSSSSHVLYTCRQNRPYDAKKTTCGNVKCDAKFRVSGSDTHGFVRGCLTHSHRFLARNKRISMLKKMELVSQLALKIPMDVILENNMYLEGDRLTILRRDLQRLKDTFLSDGKSEFESLKDVLLWEETRCFNFDKAGWKKEAWPLEIQHKWRSSDEMFVLRVSQYGLKNFIANPRSLVCDSSHNTNRNNW